MTKNMNNHVMVDIETLGNKSRSVILSISAVKFDIKTGETFEEFHRTIDLKTCLDVGLEINADTFYWWTQQSKEALEKLNIDLYLKIRALLILQ